MAKWYEIGPKLLLITNRKSHICSHMTCKSLTLNYLEGSCGTVAKRRRGIGDSTIA